MDNQAGARQPYRIVTPPSAATMACKRAFDILCSFLGLAVLSPVLLVVSVLVAVTSPGGVFFRQERIGKDGKPFRIFKFRSMRKDNAGLKITTGNDSRITPVGRFLRKSKIDELPQLINVLKGEMSLVGPRPLPVYETEAFTSDAHRRRLSVLPGVTGYWQIAGRSNIREFEKLVELDMKYIDNWSLWLDIKLLLKTVPAVLFARGAK